MRLKSIPHFSTIILAAGISKRMHSKIPKILYKILGIPVIQFVVKTAENVGSKEIVVVVGKNSKPVRSILKNRVKYALQDIPKGTGDAAKRGLEIVKNPYILILYGDVPLLKKETIQNMIENHFRKKAHLSILTCRLQNPTGYGRIVRNKNGDIIRIVEHCDANQKELKINEINTGIYFTEKKILDGFLKKLSTSNRQQEFYLTDIVHLLINENKRVIGFGTDDEEEILGINTKLDLVRVKEIVKRNWFEELMLRGVYIEDPNTTTIDLTVKFGEFVHIRPFSIIEGNTTIKDNETVGPFVWIKDGIRKRIGNPILKCPS